MFKQLGLQIDKILSKSIMSDFDPNLLVSTLNKFCTEMTPISNKTIDYGRYLAYKSDTCNIQVDIFSQEYKGQIHNHNTWGAIGIVNGNFIISDYSKISGKLFKIRSTYAVKGFVSFFPKASDIHSIECLKGLQGISIHVYGKDFDMNTGMRYIQENYSWEKYQRSDLKEFKEIESYFQIISK